MEMCRTNTPRSHPFNKCLVVVGDIVVTVGAHWHQRHPCRVDIVLVMGTILPFHVPVLLLLLLLLSLLLLLLWLSLWS